MSLELQSEKLIEYFDWIDKYKPITEEGYPENLKDFWDDQAELQKAAETNTLWTEVTGDDGDLIICSGYHYVNRFNHYITEVPYDPDYSYIVIDKDQ